MNREEKLKQIKIKALIHETEKAIDMHIAKQAKSLGYDNINSISKYLVDGNPFKIECEKLSLWCAECWIKCYNIQSEVNSGQREFPTVEKIISELPKYEQ